MILSERRGTFKFAPFALFSKYMKSRLSRFFLVVSFVLVVLAAVALGYFFGNRNFVLNQNKQVTFVHRDLGAPKDVDFNLFWEAYDQLKGSYFGEIDLKKFLYGAISGGYASLGDPYTTFLPPEATAEFEKELSGELEGIGIKIGALDDYPAVIASLPDSPAERAGLKPKDKIVKIDGTETKGMILDEAVSKIRGEKGTVVKLEIVRGSETQRTFEIKREKITVQTIESRKVDDVTVIVINEFGTETKGEFLKAVDQAAQDGADKIVLDLRNNPGGLLDGAVDVAGEIFGEKTVAVIEENHSGRREMATSGKGTLKQAKLVALVNGGSASAAEILAGAIQDHGRGKIIGEKTFGKGTVQQLEKLSGGASTKITVSHWLTPKGNSIDKNGITPDVEVKEGDNPLFDSQDPLLERALEELKK